MMLSIIKGLVNTLTLSNYHHSYTHKELCEFCADNDGGYQIQSAIRVQSRHAHRQNQTRCLQSEEDQAEIFQVLPIHLYPLDKRLHDESQR